MKGKYNMRKIQLNGVLYEIVNGVNRSASHLQFNVVKNSNTTFDDIISNADGNDIIDEYEDDTKIATFRGYSNLFVASFVKDLQSYISIELINNDIQQQIDTIDNSLENLSSDISYQQSQINNVSNDVNNITPTIITKTAYIDDTELLFNNVPDGVISVSTQDTEGNEINYSMQRVGNTVRFTFDPLTLVTEITLTIR
jgi:uncharacterized protein YoxC